MLLIKVIVKNSLFSLLVIIALCSFIFFAGIDSYGLLDKDEPRYAGCALEMLERDNYTVPKFNFQDRFDKPILFYWLIVASYRVLGVSDFSSRFPSAICATLCVLFTWYIARVVFGRVCGLICALILASSIEFILLGRRAATDMTLCLFFSSSLYSLFLSYYLKSVKIKIFWTILAGIFMGLSALTKGPIGILLPIIILTVFLFFRRSFDLKHLKIYFLIVFIAILIAFPWYYSVHLSTDGLFTKQFFFEHNLKRFTSVVSEHPGPVWFYIPVIIGGFMPWTFFFIGAIVSFIKKLLKKNFNRLLLFSIAWIITTFLFFTFSTTKFATYILLVFPPLSLITGYWIYILGKRKLVFIKSIAFSFILVLISSLGYAFYLISKWKIDQLEKGQLLNKLLIISLIMLLALILTLFFSKKSYSFVICFVLGITVPLILGINSYLIPYYKYTHLDLRGFSEFAKKENASEIISFGMYRPSLVYYSRLPVDFSDKKIQIKKIKSYSLKDKKVFIIGHSSDIKKHEKLFNKIEVLELKKKYFVGKLI